MFFQSWIIPLFRFEHYSDSLRSYGTAQSIRNSELYVQWLIYSVFFNWPSSHGCPCRRSHYAIILSHIKCRLHYGKCGGGEYLSCGKNYFKWIQHTTRIHATSFLVSAWFIVTDSADTFSDVILLNCFHFNVSTKYIIILSWSSIVYLRTFRSEADI